MNTKSTQATMRKRHEALKHNMSWQTHEITGDVSGLTCWLKYSSALSNSFASERPNFANDPCVATLVAAVSVMRGFTAQLKNVVRLVTVPLLMTEPSSSSVASGPALSSMVCLNEYLCIILIHAHLIHCHEVSRGRAALQSCAICH